MKKLDLTWQKFGKLIAIARHCNDGWDNEENFKQTVKRDEERRFACKTLNIPLYEIPYWELDNIENILNNILSTESQDEEVVAQNEWSE